MKRFNQSTGLDRETEIVELSEETAVRQQRSQLG
jgi:hypothetical protein